MKSIAKTLLASISLITVIPTAASAAVIAWSGGDITGDSNVSTNGTLLFAIRGDTGNTATTTVNGVDFLHSTRANLAASTLAQSGSESLTTTLGNDNASSFGNAGLGAISSLTQGGYWGTTSGNTATLDLVGLTVGQAYEFQFFANDARNNRSIVYEMDVDGAITLQLNNSPNNTGTGANEAGDFAIGTFTADATTQQVLLAGMLNGSANAGRTQVNGLQLRAVPEPSGIALIGLAGLGLILRRRK